MKLKVQRYQDGWNSKDRELERTKPHRERICTGFGPVCTCEEATGAWGNSPPKGLEGTIPKTLTVVTNSWIKEEIKGK